MYVDMFIYFIYIHIHLYIYYIYVCICKYMYIYICSFWLSILCGCPFRVGVRLAMHHSHVVKTVADIDIDLAIYKYIDICMYICI